MNEKIFGGGKVRVTFGNSLEKIVLFWEENSPLLKRDGTKKGGRRDPWGESRSSPEGEKGNHAAS